MLNGIVGSPTPDRVTGRDLLLLALGTGLAAGLVHVAAAWVRSRVFGAFAFAGSDVSWMAPVGYTLIVLALAAPGIAATAIFRGGTWGRWGATAVLFVGAFGMLLHVTPLHPWALLALAAGLAARAGHSLGSRPAYWRRPLTRATVLLLVLAMVVGLAGALRPWFRERQVMAGLPAPAPGTPNVLILLLDTVRAANMSLYGYGRETTPNIDRFAQGGAVFDFAFAPSSWTLPSHASLFTGRWPGQLSAGWNVSLDGTEPVLAEVMGARGYATGGFSANTWYASEETGLARGFARYEDTRRSLQQVIWSTTLAQVPWARHALKNHRLPVRLHDPMQWRWLPSEQAFHRKWAPDVTDEFLRWQAGLGGGPFMAFLNYFDAHDPYGPPGAWRTRFGADPTEQDAYDAGIALIDQEAGRLLRTLEERGVLENTLVIITSDHGEQFGEHGLKSHGNSLYLPTLHVPLVVHLPDRVPAGVRVADPVSIRDLGATLLGLIGADANAWPGTSFAGALRGSLPDSARSTALLAETEALLGRPEPGKVKQPAERGPMRAILLDHWHYVLNGDGVEELYDYRNDPQELRDLSRSPETAQVLQQLRAYARTFP